MDLNMPDIDGLEATRRSTAEFPHIPIIVLTSHSDNCFMAAALKAGAKGYIAKENAAEDLVGLICSYQRAA